jgi:hypothetical protein
MAASDLILKTLDPKITPPRIDLLDLETKGSDRKFRTPEVTGYASQLGKLAPLVKIGNVRISEASIISMNVYLNSMVPTIHLSIIDPVGSMTSVTFPKTNPLMTVYVAPNHSKLKSFSQTFLITSVIPIPLDNTSTRYDFFGELYVPNLRGNFVKSYSKLTSGQTLKKVAEELGLGFATNEDITNDSMTWINPNLTYKSFIKSVADHSYKNETSFFDCFIDRYYILNFVNVERQFNQDKDVSEGYSSYSTEAIDNSRTLNSQDLVNPDVQVPLVLSNGSMMSQLSDRRILNHSMISDNGEILKEEGFRKRVIMYRHGETDPVKNWFVEPISSARSESGSVHQTPLLDDFVKNDVVKWMGTDYGNSHPNYKFAKLINTHNRLETEKNMLQIELPGFNHNIARGSRVAVAIYSTRYKQMIDDTTQDDKSSTNSQRNDTTSNQDGGMATEILDKYLSGFYYVKEITYHYEIIKPTGRFTTRMMLSRRSWIPEPKMELPT